MAAFMKDEVVQVIETLDELTTLANKIRAVLMRGLEIIEDEEAGG